MKKILCTILVLIISLTSLSVFAKSSDDNIVTPNAIGLGGCSMSLVLAGNQLEYTVITSATTYASEIGVKNLKLQRWNGLMWVNALTLGNFCAYDDSYYALDGATTYNSGTKYRLSGTYYCIINGTTFNLNGNSNQIQS